MRMGIYMTGENGELYELFKKIWVEEFHEIWYSVFAAEPPAERR